MRNDGIEKVPVPLLRRLPTYHHLLTLLKQNGEEYVSSQTIADTLNLDPVQVRKDLASTGVAGKPKNGFNISELLEGIETFLGWKTLGEGILVGCGALGSSLLGYEGFLNCRFDIVVAFDNDPKKIGTTIRGKEILPVTKLVDLVKRMHVKLGLLTVPSQNAQQVADLMVEAGIKGIWNFAPAALNVPQDVYVHQEDMVASLAILIKKMGATELQDLHK